MEHYGIVTEHLNLLLVQEKGGKNDVKTADSAPLVVDEDEEWSDGEDEDQGEEQDAMDEIS